MSAAGLLIFMQQAASSVLDAEFDKISPELSGAIGAVNEQITQGFSTTQIALAAVALPVAYQVIKILSGYSDTHRDGIQRMRDRADKEHAAKLERETELFKAKLARGVLPELGGTAPAPPVP